MSDGKEPGFWSGIVWLIAIVGLVLGVSIFGALILVLLTVHPEAWWILAPAAVIIGFAVANYQMHRRGGMK